MPTTGRDIAASLIIVKHRDTIFKFLRQAFSQFTLRKGVGKIREKTTHVNSSVSSPIVVLCNLARVRIVGDFRKIARRKNCRESRGGEGEV